MDDELTYFERTLLQDCVIICRDRAESSRALGRHKIAAAHDEARAVYERHLERHAAEADAPPKCEWCLGSREMYTKYGFAECSKCHGTGRTPSDAGEGG